MNAKAKNRNACDPCRKRKVKCSGHRPECTHCARFSLSCEYSQAKRAGRPRRTHPLGDSQQPRSKPFSTNTAEATAHSLPASLPTRLPQSPGPASPPCRAERNHSIAPLCPSVSTPLPATRPVSDEGPFAAPEIDHAWLLSQSGPDLSDTQPFDAAQWCVPSLIQHGPVADAFLHGDTNLTTDFVPPQCQCCQDIAQYFTTVDRPAGTIERIQSLRRAMGLANRVLQCSVCFDISHGDASISKNILLLGALMSDIAMSYGHLLFRIKEAAVSRLEGPRDSFDIVFGLQTQPDAIISSTLDQNTFWWLLRGAIMEDLQRLSTMCVNFENRQLKAHELGHESCELGQPCRYGQQDPASAISKYIDTCPRSVADPKRTFACFRTVNQVFAAIRDTQKMLFK